MAIDPARLQRRIRNAVPCDPNVRIEVTDDGLVSLDGFVRTYAEKCVIEDSVRRFRGVAAVQNALEVRLTIGDYRTDATLERVLSDILDSLARMPADRPRATVTNGWVTLEGTVPHAFQKQLVEAAVREVAGVRGITNAIAIG